MTRFLEASAGTRKTTRLIGAVLDALLIDGVPVDRIAAITFTEKAAAEMRLRLGEALNQCRRGEAVRDWDATAREYAERKGADPGAVRRTARRVWQEIDRAFVGTLHSLCLRLLRLFPREAGVPPVLEADEGSVFDALFDAAWTEWIGRALEAHEGPWPRVMETVSPGALRELARALAGFRAPDRVLERPDFAQALRARSREILGNAAGRLDALAAAHPPARKPSRKDALIDVYRDALSQAPSGRLAPDARKRLLTFRAAGFGLPSKPAAGWPAAEWGDLRRIERLAKGLDVLDDGLAGEVIRLLAPFVHDFRRAYLARGVVTFDGMPALASGLLAQPEVRRQAKALFDRLFVDEFQDTDPMQYELVLALAESPDRFETDWRKIVVAPGKLMVVGDPKQSIYSFRGADLEAYTAVKRALLGGAAPERPTENWRSCRAIVDAVNAVFERVFPAVESDLQPAHARLECRMRDLCAGRADCVRAVRIEAAGAVADRTEAEAAWVAAEIRRQREAEGRGWGEFAILLRKLTRAHLFTEALRREDVPHVVEGDKFFYRQPEVLDLFNLLSAAADPLDEIALVGVLRSPIGGMTDREIYERKERGALSYLRDPEPDGVFAVLRDLHRLAGRVPPPRLIHEAFFRTPLLAAARAGYRGEIAVANLLKVLQLSTAASPRPDVSLRSFLMEFRRAIRELEEEGEDTLADEDVPAVRIMSVHKAKGLDFNVVFVPLLWQGVDEPPDAAKVSVRWATGECSVRTREFKDLAEPAMAEHAESVRDAEARRLLYVAMTRPKQRLVLCGAKPDRRSNGEGSFAAILEAAGAPLTWETEVVADRPEGAPAPAPHAVDLPALERRWEALERLRAEAARPRFLSPSSAGEEPWKAPEAAAARPAAADHAVQVGTVCHRVLEELDFGNAEADLAALLDGALRELPADADAPGVGRDALAVLRAFLASDVFRRLRSARVIGREVPILYAAGGDIVTGRIDLVYEEGDAVVVADYKTDRAASASALVERYAGQVSCYVEAIGNVLPGRPVRGALVWLPRGELVPVPGEVGRAPRPERGR